MKLIIYIVIFFIMGLLFRVFIYDNIMRIRLSEDKDDYIICYGNVERMKWAASELP